MLGQTFALPQIYANGFIINLTAADISIVLLRDNVANATVSMSFTTTKSLIGKLKEAIDKLEKATENKIMTIEVVQEGLKKEFGAEGGKQNV